MSFETVDLKKKTLVPERLLAYGFKQEGQAYFYQKENLVEGMDVTFEVEQDGKLKGQVIDRDFGDSYDIFRSSQVTGTYVGQVREAYQNLLSDIVNSCYKDSLFQSPQANRLAHYLTKTFGDKADNPFEKFPDYYSYRVAGKWYALVFPLKGEKLGFTGPKAKEIFDVVNIKVAKERIDDYLSQEGIFPSYHMSKKNWVTLILDDSLPDQRLVDLVSQSRSLVAPKHLRQESQPHYWIIPVNIKYYDITEEFAESSDILWTQKASMEAGDFVAIYITAPTKAVRYLCQVLEAHIPNEGYRDQESIKELMRIKPLVTFDDTVFSSDVLKSHAIKTVRGPRHMTDSLIEALGPYLDVKQ